MINLLPQSCQNKLRKEEISKIAAILGIVGVAALLVFILMLALVRSYYYAQLKSAQIVFAEKEREMEIFNVKETEALIVRDSGSISKVSDFFANQIKITGIFLQTAAALPQGVFLSGFSYSSGKVELNGFAPDRNSLVVFKNNLEACPDFADVVFPSENWLAAQDIDFKVNFNYAKH